MLLRLFTSLIPLSDCLWLGVFGIAFVVFLPAAFSCCFVFGRRLTLRWSQRRLRLEFMDGLSYTTIIEFAEPLARRRGSALDR